MHLLSDHFEQIAFKQLSAVEADLNTSHQHELNGVAQLKEMFGAQRREIQVAQIYLDDMLEEPLYEKGSLTWYDAREQHPSRTEYRLYYKGNRVMERLTPGDFMVIARQPNGNHLIIFAKAGSSSERQLKLLFGISSVTEHTTVQTVGGEQLDVIRDYILERIGIIDESSLAGEGFLEDMLRRFPTGLPSTREFSEYARSTINTDHFSVDDKLVEWWRREEKLFKLYEKHTFEGKRTMVSDLDSFIELSLSMQNTRKARAGSALENHTEQVLKDERLSYSRTPVTESHSRPDFIFPHIDFYRNPHFPPRYLHMLAVKTSCKDRWRQVLPEANRIERKHLLTLEPGISVNQTEDMRLSGLTLVLPKQLHSTYNADQRTWITSVSEFLELITPAEKFARSFRG